MILYSYNKRKWVTLEALQIQVTNSFSHSEVKKYGLYEIVDSILFVNIKFICYYVSQAPLFLKICFH